MAGRRARKQQHVVFHYTNRVVSGSMTALIRAIDHYGGVDKALAAAIGVSPQRLSNWKHRGVPAAMWLKIELATGGEVTVSDFAAEHEEAAA